MALTLVERHEPYILADDEVIEGKAFTIAADYVAGSQGALFYGADVQHVTIRNLLGGVTMRRYLPLLLLRLSSVAWASGPPLTGALSGPQAGITNGTVSATLTMENDHGPGWYDATIAITGDCSKKNWMYKLCRDGACTTGPESDPDIAISGMGRGASFTIHDAMQYWETGTYAPSLIVKCGQGFRYYAPAASLTVTQQDFSGFTRVTTAAELKAEIVAGTNKIWVARNGFQALDNPVVINRSSGNLLIYGEGRGVLLTSANSDAPLFRIDSCHRVRFANVGYMGPAVGQDAIQVNATSDCDLEVTNSQMGRVALNGPGRHQLENIRIGDGPSLEAAVTVNHPGAKLHWVGGDISSGATGDGTDEHYHIWVKRGWLGVWGTSVEATPGRADFRVDASEPGDLPHYITGVRSEGRYDRAFTANTVSVIAPHTYRYPTGWPARMSPGDWIGAGGFATPYTGEYAENDGFKQIVSVSGTDLVVAETLVDQDAGGNRAFSYQDPWNGIEANGNARVAGVAYSGSFNSVGDHSIFYVHSGAPTIYALGNACSNPNTCKMLIRGDIAQTKLIAIGNLLWLNTGYGDATEMVRGTPLVSMRAHNLRATSGAGNSFLLDPTNDVSGFSLPGKIHAPHPLSHPAMTSANATALSIKRADADYGANNLVGDGATDNSAKLAAILATWCVDPNTQTNDYPILHFATPASYYKFTSPIEINKPGTSCSGKYKWNSSLMLFGTASRPQLYNETASSPVLDIHGGLFPYVSDLSFKTTASTTDYPIRNFAVGVTSDTGAALNYGTMFHRVTVDGGDVGILHGHHATTGNASENMCSYCTIKNAGIGWADASANAINNNVWQHTAQDTVVMQGHGWYQEYGIDDAQVDLGTSTFTKTAHGLSTGWGIAFDNDGGGVPTPLAAATTYYVIKVTDDTFKLALTYLKAIGNDPITLTEKNGGTHWVYFPASVGKNAIGFHVAMSGVGSITNLSGDAYGFFGSDMSGTAAKMFRAVTNGATSPSTFVLHDSTMTVAPQAPGAEWFYTHRSPLGFLLLDSNITGGKMVFENYSGQRYATFLRGGFSEYPAGITLGTNASISKTGF